MSRPVRQRRRLSMTSLIDVIFLLLLFFMLTSTFSRFSEVDLVAAGAGQGSRQNETAPLFLQLAPDGLSVNGDTVRLDQLGGALPRYLPHTGPQPVLVSLRGEVTAQRLTDLLVVLRAEPELRVTVLSSG